MPDPLLFIYLLLTSRVTQKMEQQPLSFLVLRLDDGDSKTKGDFQCQYPGCGWFENQVFHYQARYHAQRQHPGVSFSVNNRKKLIPGTKEAQRKKRHRLKVKVRSKESL